MPQNEENFSLKRSITILKNLKLFFFVLIIFCSEREAVVLQTSSWLYQYYTVQRNIQYGIPFENKSVLSVPSAQNQKPRLCKYTGTRESVLTYALPMHRALSDEHRSPKHQLNQVDTYGTVFHSAGSFSNTSYQCSETFSEIRECNMFASQAKRICIEPVDYSPLGLTSLSELGEKSSNWSIASQNINNISSEAHLHLSQSQQYFSYNLSSPSSFKRRQSSKEDLIYLKTYDGLPVNDISDNWLTSNQYHHIQTFAKNRAGSEKQGSVVFATVLPKCSRILKKSLNPLDPTAFIEQWNPSPPWSESAQKVFSSESSSTSQQEPNSCVITTPPPTSASSICGLNIPSAKKGSNLSNPRSQGRSPVLTIDWVPEIAVPCTKSDGPTGVMADNYVNNE